MAELNTFDTDGDLLLLMSRPAEPETKADVETGEDVSGPEERDAGSTSSEEDVEGGNDTPEDTLDGSPDNQDPGLQNTTVSTPESKPDDTNETEPKKPDIEVHMLVSSKHLMLASPVFKAMLKRDTFKEGRTLSSNGRVEVPLPDDNVAAFIIILDIIHGRNRRVPRQVSLEMMTNLSILVDKYQMLEAVEVFSDAWIEDLKVNLPEQFDDNMGRWLAISWVFGKRVEFKTMTQYIEQQSGVSKIGNYFDPDLPIPHVIFDAIKEKRREAMFNAYALIEQTLKRYQKKELLCPRTDGEDLRSACDAMLLGSLLRSATIQGVWPAPAPPYDNTSFSELADKIENLDVNGLCDKISKVRINGKFPQAAHGLKVLITQRITALEETLSGLDIDEFKEKKKKAMA